MTRCRSSTPHHHTQFVSDDVLDEWRKIDPTIKVVGQKTLAIRDFKKAV
ncbi:hypothetical protein ACYULU_13955 [Breznakiellaceae bacterium SP9]